eukprot:7841404-Pyramimonas_sp.AAC.1
MPGVSATCSGVSISRIDYALVSASFSSAVQLRSLVPVPWGTHAALGFQASASPRAVMVWKAMRPRPLPVKGVAAPVEAWPHFL